LTGPHFPGRIINLIINPEFESLCPPLSEERDEARAEADHAKSDQDVWRATSQTCSMI
jgi:hypothetical protein